MTCQGVKSCLTISFNFRSVLKDEKVNLSPPTRYTVEELIGYMQSGESHKHSLWPQPRHLSISYTVVPEDELIEVTPKSVRLRKALLDSGERERAMRAKAKQLRAGKS